MKISDVLFIISLILVAAGAYLLGGLGAVLITIGLELAVISILLHLRGPHNAQLADPQSH